SHSMRIWRWLVLLLIPALGSQAHTIQITLAGVITATTEYEDAPWDSVDVGVPFFVVAAIDSTATDECIDEFDGCTSGLTPDQSGLYSGIEMSISVAGIERARDFFMEIRDDWPIGGSEPYDAIVLSSGRRPTPDPIVRIFFSGAGSSFGSDAIPESLADIPWQSMILDIQGATWLIQGEISSLAVSIVPEAPGLASLSLAAFVFIRFRRAVGRRSGQSKLRARTIVKGWFVPRGVF
ncbi:MAG: hypothetical protein ACRDKE_07400, partial [Solirubrobacterales bacterium]